MNYCSFLKKIHLASSYFLILVLRDRKEKIHSETREKKVHLLQIQVCDEGIPELLKKKKKFSNMKDLPEFFFARFLFILWGLNVGKFSLYEKKQVSFFRFCFFSPNTNYLKISFL